MKWLQYKNAVLYISKKKSMLVRELWKYHHHYHQRVLIKGRSFNANSGIKAAVLTEGRSSTANSETRVAGLLGMNSYGCFPLLSTPHSLFSIWRELKWSEKIPGAPSWKLGEWIWLSGPSGLHRNSPQTLISVQSGFWPYQKSGNPNHPSLWYLKSTLICRLKHDVNFVKINIFYTF